MAQVYYVKPDELYHYGILGMKWGIRRYQNPDGTLTAAGKKRYGVEGEKKKENSSIDLSTEARLKRAKEQDLWDMEFIERADNLAMEKWPKSGIDDILDDQHKDKLLTLYKEYLEKQEKDARTDDELYHYGILGMKWGVRRYQNPDGTLTAAGKKRYDKAAKTLDELSSNKSDPSKKDESGSDTSDTQSKSGTQPESDPSSLTDDELRALINRIKLEKDYREAVKSITPTEENRYLEMVKKIADKSISNIGEQVGVYVLGTAVNRLAVLLGSKDPAIVYPKKGQKPK